MVELTYNQKYYQKNKQKIDKHTKEYRRTHKKEMQLYDRQYYDTHVRKKREKQRLEIINLLGGKCANPFNLIHPDWCNDIRVLQIDHVHGGGKKERKMGQWKMYALILKAIKSGSKDYQCLCANCNWIKVYENNEIKRK